MLEPTDLAEQVAAGERDRLRVLVVGAGMAGLTLAQLLRRDGLHPVLVERASPDDDAGYMLGMMPIIDPAIDALDVRPAYEASSVPVRRYRLRGRHGTMLRQLGFTDLLGDLGEVRGIDRGALRDALSAHGAPVTFDTSVSALRQRDDGTVVAELTGGAATTEAVFDLVVAADGLHSHTRGLVVDEDAVESFDPGWGGWVAWAPPVTDGPVGYEETWGDGFFVGTYPVHGATGVFVGGPHGETEIGPEAFVARTRTRLGEPDPSVSRALDAVDAAGSPYYWDISDVRAPRWRVGSTLLLGDAAAGFLPTAGIGAAMAIESAHVLAAHLRTASGPADLPRAVDAYETAQRPRVESAQTNSRQLARLMGWQGRRPVAATLRDLVLRFTPAGSVMKPIRTLIEHGPDLPAQA